MEKQINPTNKYPVLDVVSGLPPIGVTPIERYSRIAKLFLRPETGLESRLLENEELVKGLFWGKPRNGHPEGVVIAHVKDVLNNIEETRYIDREHREKLRLIAIIHDSFKYMVDRGKPRSGENHHAMIARRFAEKHIIDDEVLEVIEVHDEAYNSYMKGIRSGIPETADKRIGKLLDRLSSDALTLFTFFYMCDDSTGNKNPEPFDWFIKKMYNYLDDKF